jgi:hypothetical protein
LSPFTPSIESTKLPPKLVSTSCVFSRKRMTVSPSFTAAICAVPPRKA